MTVGLILPKYPGTTRRTGKHEDSRLSTADLIVLDGLTKTLDRLDFQWRIFIDQIDKRRTKKNKKSHNHPLDFERLFFGLLTRWTVMEIIKFTTDLNE
jgi:hypothetical protein